MTSHQQTRDLARTSLVEDLKCAVFLDNEPCGKPAVHFAEIAYGDNFQYTFLECYCGKHRMPNGPDVRFMSKEEFASMLVVDR